MTRSKLFEKMRNMKTRIWNGEYLKSKLESLSQWHHGCEFRPSIDALSEVCLTHLHLLLSVRFSCDCQVQLGVESKQSCKNGYQFFVKSQQNGRSI